MTSYSLKRRRPHAAEGYALEPTHQDLAYSSSSGLARHSLPSTTIRRYTAEQLSSVNVSITVPLSRLFDLDNRENQCFLWQQAASSLNLPVRDITALRSRILHRTKRKRLNHEMPLSHAHTQSPSPRHPPEKLSVTPEPQSAGGSSSWGGSRFVGCMANLAACPPCASYEPDTRNTPSSSHIHGGIMPQNHGAAAAPHSASGPWYPAAAPVAEPPNLMSADDGTMMTQYLPQYPILQPDRLMAIQPPAHTDNMVYPGQSSEAVLMTPPAGEWPHLGPALPASLGQQDLLNIGSVGPGFASGVTAAFHTQGNSFMPLPPRYDMPPSYGPPRRADTMTPGLSQGPEAAYSGQRTSPVSRRGPFKDQDKREKTAQTRKIGSCVRCRMQRIRCNLDTENEKGSCLNCKKIAGANARMWRVPCLRAKITDVKLFKPGQVKGHEWTSRWQDTVFDEVGHWASAESRVIRVTEGYTGKAVELRVREFVPQSGDKLDRSWVSNGMRKSVKIPPYAIVDLEAAKTAFDDYIKQEVFEVCKQLLGPREKLLWKTYALAYSLMQQSSTPPDEKKLLCKTFELWMSIRLTTKSFEIVGNETLGMPRDLIKDDDSPLRGKIPLPPVMGAQIDAVLIHQSQSELRRETLEDLQRMTQEKKQKTWLTTYLVTFILLHNMALITRHDADYAKKHGMKRRFAREDKVQEYNYGATTLLAYFHYCNKGVFPFSEDCRDQDLTNLAGLDQSMLDHVKMTRRYVADHKRQWEDLWATNEYENEYYFVSQLFEQNWQPRSMG